MCLVMVFAMEDRYVIEVLKMPKVQRTLRN